MKIAKVINNNVISVVNEQGKELVVMGRGLAFQKKSGDDVDEARIEKVFTLDNKDVSDVKDEVGSFSKITSVFSERGVSFEKILQLPIKGHDELAEIVIVTHHTSEADFSDILQNLNDLEVVQEVKSTYRVEGNGWS